MTGHDVTFTKHKRIPLDPFFTPVCALCGPLQPAPSDVETARDTRRAHVADIAATERSAVAS